MLRKIQKKPLNLQKIYMSDDLAKSGGELEKIGLVPLSDDKLKASQKHVEDRKILNDELVKLEKFFKENFAKRKIIKFALFYVLL